MENKKKWTSFFYGNVEGKDYFYKKRKREEFALYEN